jgi:hypothetical protein
MQDKVNVGFNDDYCRDAKRRSFSRLLASAGFGMARSSSVIACDRGVIAAKAVCEVWNVAANERDKCKVSSVYGIWVCPDNPAPRR